jgi:hypothetical protein
MKGKQDKQKDSQDEKQAGADERAYRIPNPGKSDREHRVKEALTLLRAEVREEHPEFSTAQVKREAEKRLAEHRKQHPKFDQKYEETEPGPSAPRRADTNQDIEMAAMMRLPLLQGLWNWLPRWAAGRPAKRFIVVALFLHMVFMSGKPDVLNTWKKFRKRTDMRDFIWGELSSLHQSSVYRGLEAMLKRRWPQVCRHINAALWQELADQKNPDGSPMFPDAGKYLVIDGTYIQAHVPQRPARKNEDDEPDPEHEALLRGGRKMAAFTGHKPERGYKLMAIAELSTKKVLVQKLFESTVTETQAARELLERLFELYPDLPAEYLIGDAAYDQKEFAWDCFFRWGLHPVFARGEGKPYGKEHKYTLGNKEYPGIDGVPTCKCGPMKLRDTDRFWDANRRAEAGIKRGELAPSLDARLRWTCPNGDEAHPNRVTTPSTEARIYTYLPRAGAHPRVALRDVLMVRRNLIECLFAQLKGNGHGGPRQWRAFWAEDQEMEWLLYASSMLQTARHLVHVTGQYDEVYAEAEELGLLAEDGPPLDEVTRKRMLRDRAERLPEPEVPASWEKDSSEGGYTFELRDGDDCDEGGCAA